MQKLIHCLSHERTHHCAEAAYVCNELAHTTSALPFAILLGLLVVVIAMLLFPNKEH